MSNLGELLRNAREKQGLSLDDIQESTKIRKRYLEAIESGDHTILPGPFYVRAFVKNYSEAVGLDPEEVLRLYQHEVPAPPAAEQIAEPATVRPPRRVKSQSSERLGKIGFNVVMWSFLILIVVVVWVFVINRDADEPKTVDQNTNITDASEPPATATDDNTAADDVTPDVSPATPAPTLPPTTVTFDSKVGRADQYVIGPAGNHKVEIKISGGKSWIEVREGSSTGNKLFSSNADDGSIQNYELTGTLFINTGRADLTEITVDGVLVPDGDRASLKKLLLAPVEAEASAAENAETGETTNGQAASE
ncbi:RodZ domain-containing protein [Paenibacillus sp. sgz302251]|uniref:helix-turn-helix domain-containing protein n=1 Tax=Paenibacillus sp. sgz302251 TaxID=3414493 RepID=UPI003C79D396